MACDDSAQTAQISDSDKIGPVIQATHIRLETQMGQGPVIISGNRLETENRFSQIDQFQISGNVQISLPASGTVGCDRLAIGKDMQSLKCEGNVRGRFLLPPNMDLSAATTRKKGIAK